MFDVFGVTDWAYDHRVGIYLSLGFLVSLFYSASQKDDSSTKAAEELEEEHLMALSDDEDFTPEQELEYFKASQLAAISDAVQSLGWIIAFFGGLFAVHFIM